MILVLFYNLLGWVFLIGGSVIIIGSFVQSMTYLPWGIGCLAAGLINIGLAEICGAIGKISENSRKSAEHLDAIRQTLANTDKLRAEEARSIRDLLVKVAISAPTILPAGAAKAEKPVTFYYSGNDMTSRGPFSVETMRALIADGSISAETPVALEGSAEWHTYPNFPELV